MVNTEIHVLGNLATLFCFVLCCVVFLMNDKSAKGTKDKIRGKSVSYHSIINHAKYHILLITLGLYWKGR